MQVLDVKVRVLLPGGMGGGNINGSSSLFEDLAGGWAGPAADEAGCWEVGCGRWGVGRWDLGSTAACGPTCELRRSAGVSHHENLRGLRDLTRAILLTLAGSLP